KGAAVLRDDSAVRQRVDLAPMNAFGAAVQALGLQHEVHRGRAQRPIRECGRKSLRVLAAAFETRPVPGRERRHLVEEKKLRIALAPDVAMPALEVEHAADPLARRVTPAA